MTRFLIPLPKTAERISQKLSVNGYTRMEKRTTPHFAIGFVPTASGRTVREETIATPTKRSSTPTAIEIRRGAVSSLSLKSENARSVTESPMTTIAM